MILKWIKCSGDQWCDFLRVNLEHPHFDGVEGVYIIWHGAPDPAVVYVGQGSIRDRLSQHRMNQEILFYKDRGLYVTWAELSAPYRDGVERYLADKWHPKVGQAHPTTSPIPCDSPWQ